LDFVEPDNAADVWNAYMVSQWFAPPAIRSSAFEELVSTGRLSIIEKLALRDSISSFYTEYSSIADMAAKMVDHSYTRFSRSIVSYELYHAGQVLGEYDATKMRASFEALCSKPEFAELSNIQLTTHISNIQFISMYSDFANELLEELAAHDKQ
jgi:hypothetical protein